MKVILSGIIEGYRSLLDKSVKIIIETQEVTAEDIGKIHSLCGQYGKMLFSTENIIKEVEEAVEDFKIKEEKKEAKTPSQRLRNNLYILWTIEGGFPSSEEHYDNYMTKLISSVQNKIDEAKI